MPALWMIRSSSSLPIAARTHSGIARDSMSTPSSTLTVSAVSSGDGWRHAARTTSPRAARARHRDRPIPRLAPVTSAKPTGHILLEEPLDLVDLVGRLERVGHVGVEHDQLGPLGERRLGGAEIEAVAHPGAGDP